MRQQWGEEALPGLTDRSGRGAAHPEPGLDKGPGQPRPDRALVVGAVALHRATGVHGVVARLAGGKAPGTQRGPETLLRRVHDTLGDLALQHRVRQPAHREELVGPDTGVHGPALVVDVHDIIEPAAVGAHEPAAERGDRPAVQPGPAVVPGCRDAQRVDPQRLDLHRLADAGGDHPVAHLGIHPGELHAGNPCPQQAIGVHPDVVAGAGGITFYDGVHRREQAVPLGRRKPPARLPPLLQELVHGDHVPERRVHRVELGGVAGLHEPVRELALRHRPGPLHQDRPGIVPPAAGEAEAPKRDEGVPAPVCEPGIAGNHRHALAAADQVLVRRALQRPGEGGPPLLLGLGQTVDGGQGPAAADGLHAAGTVHRDQPDGVGFAHRPGEFAGGGEVFGVVEPAGPLLLQEEVPVPAGIGVERPVGQGMQRRQRAIGVPAQPLSAHFGGHPEVRILMVHRVGIAAGQERAHDQPPFPALEPPPEAGHRPVPRQKQLLGDGATTAQVPGPGGPRVNPETGQAGHAIGMGHVRGVALRRERDLPLAGHQPDFHARQHDGPPAGRRHGRDEQPMVAAGPPSRGGAAGEAAQAVGLEPLAGEPLRCHGSHATSTGVAARCASRADRSSMWPVTGQRRGCSSLATSPVHPVWWEAPTPRPVSPWKYSWNSG